MEKTKAMLRLEAFERAISKHSVRLAIDEAIEKAGRKGIVSKEDTEAAQRFTWSELSEALRRLKAIAELADNGSKQESYHYMLGSIQGTLYPFYDK